MKKRSIAATLITLLGGMVALSPPAHAEPTRFSMATSGRMLYNPRAHTATTDATLTCWSESKTDQAQFEFFIEQGGAESGYWRTDLICDGNPTTFQLTFRTYTGEMALEEGPAQLMVFGESDDGWLDFGWQWTTISIPASAAIKPSVPRYVYTTRGFHRVNLRWITPAVGGGSTITGYQVQRGTAVRSRRNISRAVRYATFTRLVNGHRYSFYVRARNRVGYSRWVRAYGTPRSPARPRAYGTCTSMNNGMWPHGVGRSGARDRTSGTPVTTFAVSTTGYRINDGRVRSRGQYDLDRDNDGIACESR